MLLHHHCDAIITQTAIKAPDVAAVVFWGFDGS
jgi:hypothetical protein